MKNILCFGDSNTFGCNPQSDVRDWVPPKENNPFFRFGRDVRWTGVLQKNLGEEYYVIEEGLPGRTFVYDDAILPGRSGKEYVLPCMMSHLPIDLMIIMLGTNDAKRIYGSAIGTLVMGLEGFLQVVKTPSVWLGQKPNILLIAPPPLGDRIQSSPDYGMFDERSVELTKQFSEVYPRVAAAQECFFLDAGLYAHADENGDSIHITAEGHRALGIAIADKVKDIFMI